MLELKNQVKQLFEDKGIPELTVGRSSQGFLTVIGKECGQPIMTISQVEIPSKLTKATRNIVINDYLIPALDKHTTNFINLITAKKAFKAAEAIKDTEWEKLKLIGYDHRYHNLAVDIKFAEPGTTKDTTPLEFTYKLNENIFYCNTTASIKYHQAILNKAKEVPKETKAYVKAVKECDKLSEELKEEADKLKTVCGW